MRQHELASWLHPAFDITLEKRFKILVPWPVWNWTEIWVDVASGNSYTSYSGAPGTYRWRVDGISSNSSLKYTIWSRH